MTQAARTAQPANQGSTGEPPLSVMKSFITRDVASTQAAPPWGAALGQIVYRPTLTTGGLPGHESNVMFCAAPQAARSFTIADLA